MEMGTDRREIKRAKEPKQTIHKKFAEDTTLHGYKHVFEKSGFRRLIWILLMIGSTTLSAILFYGTIKEYIKYNTVIVVGEDFSITEADFPTVTICNLNSIARNMNVNLPKNQTKEEFISILVRAFPKVSGVNINISDPDVISFFSHIEKLNITSMKEVITLLDVNMTVMQKDDALKHFSSQSCTFEGTTCSAKDFKATVSWDTSLCYKFNFYESNNKQRLKSRMQGLNSGISLFLNTHAKAMATGAVPFQGLAVFIHPYGTAHFLSAYTSTFVIQPGSMHLVYVREIQTHLLPPPYASKCGETKYSLVKNHPYTKATCEIDCLMNRVYKICGCVGFELEDMVGDNITICTVHNWKCYIEQRIHECDILCPNECVRRKYTIQTSQTKLGRNDIFEQISKMPGWKLNMSETIQYVSDNLIGLHIGFSEMTPYVETVSAAVTWHSLLGSIGGNMGLCLGFSFMTACEFIFLAYDYLFLSMRRIKAAAK